jgi:hypothetical protein
MIVVGKVVEIGLETEPRLSLVVQRHRQRRTVVHRDGEPLAVDEELLDDVAPLRLLLVAGDKRRHTDVAVVQRPLALEALAAAVPVALALADGPTVQRRCGGVQRLPHKPAGGRSDTRSIIIRPWTKYL